MIDYPEHKSPAPPPSLEDELVLIRQLAATIHLDRQSRRQISRQTESLVQRLRSQGKPTFLQSFLGEYGLSTEEGVALMSMAESFLRIPDVHTLDDLITEKITGSNWHSHTGQASSFLVNASTWALMLSGHLLTETQHQGLIPAMRKLLRRFGEPVVRLAMTQAMEQLGNHFVVGQDIDGALRRTARDPRYEDYRFSFDMLGESALTAGDAEGYFQSYVQALKSLSKRQASDPGLASGISVKLSALHPRFELTQQARSQDLLLQRMLELSRLAAAANVNLNIDGEEVARIGFTHQLFATLAENTALRDWGGLGLVVQAYSRNTLPVIHWLQGLATRTRQRFMIRLVKGAYWDTEIKRSQVLGLESYPVFTRKAFTDIAYLAAADRLLQSERLYPQFATHNAHTLVAVLELARQHGRSKDQFEFQRLYGMGEDLHELTRQQHRTRHRIYGPVGVHQDLLAYLVRRLLENGANSSFVHQLTNAAVRIEDIAADPLAAADDAEALQAGLPSPGMLFPGRQNSRGWDLGNPAHLLELDALTAPFAVSRWDAMALLVQEKSSLNARGIFNPANPADQVGTVVDADESCVQSALVHAAGFTGEWSARPVQERAAVLEQSARLLEHNAGEILTLLRRESGKTLSDAIGELREAVDFLRYYAQQARSNNTLAARQPLGIMVCISPWNFPLSIFLGQIAAALVTGNTVLAKPAEQTPLIAARSIAWLHEAGVPRAALQLLSGDGRVGQNLCGDPRINGVCFTGSTAVAHHIQHSLAKSAAPQTRLVAETGGINAMIVDSTALPEQSVRDIVSSAFSSAGQRCSALRIVYLQQDIADTFIAMLKGAMDQLCVADPILLQTDVGPVIDSEARATLMSYIDSRKVLHRVEVPQTGYFVPPVLIEVDGIGCLEQEIFGPVLHLARFAAQDLDQVVDDINLAGYGLTCAVHSRLTLRVERCIERLRVGNIYVNRNQIGAVVESQPFGGCGFSGTGPKAGGPLYLQAFTRSCSPPEDLPQSASGPLLSASLLHESLGALDNRAWTKVQDRHQLLHHACPHALALEACHMPLQQRMPGPTGERNLYQLRPAGSSLCLGPHPDQGLEQALQALAFGNRVLVCCPADSRTHDCLDILKAYGAPIIWLEACITPDDLSALADIDTVSWCGDQETARRLRQALARRTGPLVRFITDLIDPVAYLSECHVCNDITSSGGNVELMAGDAAPEA